MHAVIGRKIQSTGLLFVIDNVSSTQLGRGP